MSQNEAAVRRIGALVALAAASGLVLVVATPVEGSGYAVLALYAIYLLGCAAVLLSPAVHRVVSDLTRRAAETGREIYGVPKRAATELWTALVPDPLEKRSCAFPASSPAGARPPWQTEAAMRRAGALVALGAACVLVLVPAVEELRHGSLAVYAVAQLGCAAVLLSPAHRAVADLARRAGKAARTIFAAPGRAATELWSARARLLKPNPCSSTWSPAGARATSQTEASARRTGAVVVLGAASILVLVLFPAGEDLKIGVLALYAIALLGCAAVLLSPAHCAVTDLARRAAQATSCKLHRASARANTVLRWAGFACIAFCVAAADMPAAEEANGLLLFLLFLMGVSTVSLSMLAADHPRLLPLWLPRPPPPPAAEKGRDGGEVNITDAAVASKV